MRNDILLQLIPLLLATCVGGFFWGRGVIFRMLPILTGMMLALPGYYGMVGPVAGLHGAFIPMIGGSIFFGILWLNVVLHR